MVANAAAAGQQDAAERQRQAAVQEEHQRQAAVQEEHQRLAAAQQQQDCRAECAEATRELHAAQQRERDQAAQLAEARQRQVRKGQDYRYANLGHFRPMQSPLKKVPGLRLGPHKQRTAEAETLALRRELERAKVSRAQM
eukprot:SAG22_NODE_1556_length_4131_cov_3.350942_4_plen_140_part_00